MSWTAWSPTPLVVGGTAAALMLFARAFIRLRRRNRSDHAGWSRAGLFLLAVGVALLALISPLDAAAGTSLTAHMCQHLLIGDVAPALALLALRGPLLVFLVPAAALRWLSRSSRLQAAFSFVLRPHISLAAWALVLAAWHVPAAYDYALTHPAAHDLEHISFLVVGLLAWAQLIDPTRRKTLRLSHKVNCAIAMLALGLALTVLLLFAGPLYPAYAHQYGAHVGLSPALDQRVAGLVMLSVQLALLSLGFGFLLSTSDHPRIGRERHPLPMHGLAASPPVGPSRQTAAEVSWHSPLGANARNS